MQYTVIQTIQSVRIDDNEPVEVQFYRGTDRAEAITALAQASAVSDPSWVALRSVRMDVAACCWEDNQYQSWARVSCSGVIEPVTREDMTGLMCDAHVTAWDNSGSGKMVSSPFSAVSR